MATKTFEELKQLAIQIRDEKTNKQNTATRVGTAMLEHINKLEQDYYDKTQTDEELKERDDKLIELESNNEFQDDYTSFNYGEIGGAEWGSNTVEYNVETDIFGDTRKAAKINVKEHTGNTFAFNLFNATGKEGKIMNVSAMLYSPLSFTLEVGFYASATENDSYYEWVSPNTLSIKKGINYIWLAAKVLKENNKIWQFVFKNTSLAGMTLWVVSCIYLGNRRTFFTENLKPQVDEINRRTPLDPIHIQDTFINDQYVKYKVANWNPELIERNIETNIFGIKKKVTKIKVPSESYVNRNQFEIPFYSGASDERMNLINGNIVNINCIVYVPSDCSVTIDKYDPSNQIENLKILIGANTWKKGINRVVLSANVTNFTGTNPISAIFNTNLPENTEYYILDTPITYMGYPSSNTAILNDIIPLQNVYTNLVKYPLRIKNDVGLAGFNISKNDDLSVQCIYNGKNTGWVGISFETELIDKDKIYYAAFDIEVHKNILTEGSTSEAGNNYFTVKKYPNGEGKLTSIVTGTRGIIYAEIPASDNMTFTNYLLLQIGKLDGIKNLGDIDFTIYDICIVDKDSCYYDNISDFVSAIKKDGFGSKKYTKNCINAINAQTAEVAKRVLSTEGGSDIDLTGDSLVAQGWGDYLSQYLDGRKVYSHGFGGKKSTYIRDQFLSYLNKKRTQIINVGRNNYTDTDVIIDDIRDMVEAYGGKNFLILMPPNGNYGTFGTSGSDGTGEMKGGDNYNKFLELSDRLAKEYGDNFLDTREATIYAYRMGNIKLSSSFVQPEIGSNVQIEVTDATFLTTYNSNDLSKFGEDFMKHIRIGLNGVYDKYKVISKEDNTHLTVQLVEANYKQPSNTVDNLQDNGGSNSVIYLRVMQEADYICYIYDTTASTFRSDGIHMSENGKKLIARLVANKVKAIGI